MPHKPIDLDTDNVFKFVKVEISLKFFIAWPSVGLELM